MTDTITSQNIELSSWITLYMNVSSMQCVAVLQSLTPGGGVPGAAGRIAPPLVGAAHAAGSGSATRRLPGTARSSVRWVEWWGGIVADMVGIAVA